LLATLALCLLPLAASAAPARDPETTPPGLDPIPLRPTLSARPLVPFDAAQSALYQRAHGFLDTGLDDRARSAFEELLGRAPHHPLVLAELASLMIEREQWREVEAMARRERIATRDSVLLGRELALALEWQRRPREAAQVAMECWLVAPLEGPWAAGTLGRLAVLEPRAVRDLVRRAAERRPPPPIDLFRFGARLEHRLGATEAAIGILADLERSYPGLSQRWTFADELLREGTARDTTGAIAALHSLGGEAKADPRMRKAAIRRAWQLHAQRGTESDGAMAIVKALRDVPGDQWDNDLLLGVMRALREGGHPDEARALMGRLGPGHAGLPELQIERALNDLREGPPERVLVQLEDLAQRSPEAAFRSAEAHFFAGRTDSALARYQRVAVDPRGPFTGAALERIYLIEDARPATALPAFGRLYYEQWRGEPRRALAIADSLYAALPHGPLWGIVAVELAALRDRMDDPRAALEPLLAFAGERPDDRLAPVARQRAGDLYRLRLKDDAKALEQYEECLARYPRAWNAPEVRRQLEALRRDRRF
jgi:tetratricopeptide (TPR) repeat protein